MERGDLPIFPDGREIEIADYNYITKALRAAPVDISDYNFTNIFSWRNAYQYKISRLNGMIITEGIDINERFILPPIGERNRAAETGYEAIKIASDNNSPLWLAVAPEWMMKQLKEKNDLTIIPDKDNWDYVYKSQELAELPGQKYHAKKNLIRQFADRYNAVIEELDKETCIEAMEYSDKWCEQRDCQSNDGLKKEKCAIFQMLTHFETLKLHGILVRINGEITGLAMGEELAPNTYVVHVEKGDNHLKGIYQYINQQLAQRIAPRYEWINREQDLGIEGLRRAKQSYYPDHYIVKYGIQYSGGTK